MLTIGSFGTPNFANPAGCPIAVHTGLGILTLPESEASASDDDKDVKFALKKCRNYQDMYFSHTWSYEFCLDKILSEASNISTFYGLYASWDQSRMHSCNRESIIIPNESKWSTKMIRQCLKPLRSTTLKMESVYHYFVSKMLVCSDSFWNRDLLHTSSKNATSFTSSCWKR